jgi:6-phosphogluconolactonase
MRTFWRSQAARALLAAAFIVPGAWPADPLAAKEYFVYIGTYTGGGKSKGIYLFRLDSATGKLTPQGLAAETPNPSFLNFHPNGKFLYAVSEMPSSRGGREGGVSAFSIDPASGKLTLINTRSSRGAGPCFVRADATGKVVLVANYNSGSVAALPVKEDGSLGEAVGFQQHADSLSKQGRQPAPHAHSANFSADNRFAVVADLGLDKLMVYRLDPAQAAITPNDPPFFSTAPGAGPRHFTFDPSGKHGYVINEINSTVTAMSWDKERGAFTELQTVSTVPSDFKGENTTAEVQVHPSGKFLYGSNRGHDSIVEFAIDDRGKLKLVGHTPTEGKVPRNFGIDPTGRWLIAANQNTDSLVVFAIDQKTGKLSPNGQSVKVSSPVCVKFLPVR